MSKEVQRIIEQPDDLMPAMQWAWDMAGRGLAGGPVRLALGRPERKRSLDQNKRLWCVLRDVSEQVEWYGRYLPDHAWKDIFTAALERQDIVPGIDGGFVIVGGRTSKMDRKKFADLLTIIDAFGAEHGVRWSDPALAVCDDYKEAAA